MSEVFEGISAINEIIRRMKDPDECDPVQLVQLEHLVNGLAQEVMALGNAVLQAREIRDDLMENMDSKFYATGATNAYLRLAGGMPGEEGPGLIAHLEGIGRRLTGRVRLDLEKRVPREYESPEGTWCPECYHAGRNKPMELQWVCETCGYRMAFPDSPARTAHQEARAALRGTGERESEPDGPVGDTSDGYTIKPGEE